MTLLRMLFDFERKLKDMIVTTSCASVTIRWTNERNCDNTFNGLRDTELFKST